MAAECGLKFLGSMGQNRSYDPIGHTNPSPANPALHNSWPFYFRIRRLKPLPDGHNTWFWNTVRFLFLEMPERGNGWKISTSYLFHPAETDYKNYPHLGPQRYGSFLSGRYILLYKLEIAGTCLAESLAAGLKKREHLSRMGKPSLSSGPKAVESSPLTFTLLV